MSNLHFAIDGTNDEGVFGSFLYSHLAAANCVIWAHPSASYLWAFFFISKIRILNAHTSQLVFHLNDLVSVKHRKAHNNFFLLGVIKSCQQR